MKNGRNVNPVGDGQKAAQERRVAALYGEKGGPLLGWLLDEARQRGLQLKEMADELGVTYGYINQLRTGVRETESIGQDFAEACGRFIGVPTIVVKLLAGRIQLRDFAWPYEGEEGLVERAYRQMMSDPTARQLVMPESSQLSHEARKALVMMYANATGQDVLGIRHLAWVIEYLQRAAIVHEGRYETYGNRGESLVA